MGQGRLAGSRRIATANQPRRANRVMRRPERPSPCPACRQAAAGAGDARHLEPLGGREWRQDRGQAAGRQRLAGAGRADHEQAVPTGSSDLERVAQVALPAQVGQIWGLGACISRELHRLRRLWRPLAVGESRELLEPFETDHLDLSRQGRLRPVLGRDGDRLDATLARRLGDRQHPGHRAQRPVEGELADHRQRRPVREVELARGSQQRGGDRQVEAGARLAQAGRGEVGDDPAEREVEAAVDHRRPHPLARLAHRRVGEPDDGKGRQPAVDVDLDPDGPGRDAVEGEGLRRGEHGEDAKEVNPTRGAHLFVGQGQLCHGRRAAARIGVDGAYRRPG